MSLPLVKFGVLVVKQVAKPLANQIKRVVKKSNLFGKVIAVPGQGVIKYLFSFLFFDPL